MHLGERICDHALGLGGIGVVYPQRGVGAECDTAPFMEQW